MTNRQVRTVLLSKILSIEGVFQHKYTTCYNTLSSVIDLEKKEEQAKLPKEIFEKFNHLKELSNNLEPKLKGIPLLIIEQYFLRNSNKLEKYLYINYKDIEVVDMKVSDLYIVLENFFYEIYNLAVEISDYYSLDVKLKSTDSAGSNEIF